MSEIRVLTIKEPYVTPIAAGIKHYETRAYKTNYRGEIYIHTAKTTMEVPDGGNAGTMPLGCIVLKAVLTDCIRMDDGFIEEINKDRQEALWGFYSVDRWAWKLENVEVIEPIRANGSLGIWRCKYEAETIHRNLWNLE